MVVDKNSGKPGARRAKAAPASSKDRPRNVLCKMSPGELAGILRALLEEHPDLKSEANELAMVMLSSPTVEGIAEEVFFDVTSLDLEDLDSRVGQQPWGYVEPCDAAAELLEEAIDGAVSDMKRRLELGLTAAAVTVCCGIALGLYNARDAGSNCDPLATDPDFPTEGASNVVVELIRTCPAKERKAVRDQLDETLGEVVPEWHGMLLRAADGVLDRKHRACGPPRAGGE